MVRWEFVIEVYPKGIIIRVQSLAGCGYGEAYPVGGKEVKVCGM